MKRIILLLTIIAAINCNAQVYDYRHPIDKAKELADSTIIGYEFISQETEFGYMSYSAYNSKYEFLDVLAKADRTIRYLERIRKENERLKKEAEERERLAKIEAKKRAKEEAERKVKEEVERKAREEKERKEREAYEAKLKAEREERERIEREEREKREKLEAELKAKQEAELKAKEAEEARLQAELNKGDEDKVKDLIADLEALKTKYTFKSAKNQKMYADVYSLIDKVINHIEK